MHRVLVVDDHVANCVPLAKLFKYAGLNARCALGGRLALDELAATPAADLPDVVLLDIMMPEMDGFEVLRRLRADARYDGVVVLMYTAAIDLTYHAEAVRSGAQGYILKGTPFADVRAAVARHLPGP